MKGKLTEFFRIPREIRRDFWEDTLQHNRVSLLVICVMIFGMELFNMCRVLFLSNAGLSTWNNRMYFGMYCSLFLVAALYLGLWHFLRRWPCRVRWAVQYITVLCMLLWHGGMNAYDIHRDPQAGTSIFVTAVLGLAVFIQMSPAFAFLAYGAGYGLFAALAFPVLESGDQLNLTITSIVSLAIALTRSHHAVVLLLQRREISEINQQLRALVQQDPLTGLLNKTALQHQAEYRLSQGPAPAETALLILDMDDFKAVNDRYGHPCGDYILQEVGRKLWEVFPGEAVGRIGGDEFAVVCSGGRDSLEQAADKLIREVASLRWKGTDIGVACSVGICLAGRAGVDYQRLYREADNALYQAKNRGKGRYSVGAV